ncbi:hypothetical protein M426DRAFT_322599 [Hypoxylon sp. CI-4A]|nr:hypothetical protein M426DRAFT_322599 [Hypoxylon sp. CI-4A]
MALRKEESPEPGSMPLLNFETYRVLAHHPNAEPTDQTNPNPHARPHPVDFLHHSRGARRERRTKYQNGKEKIFIPQRAHVGYV